MKATYFPNFPKPAYPHAHLPLVTDMDVPGTMLMQALYRCLSVKRPHRSMAEARLVAWLVNRLPVTMIDGAGNVHVDLRTSPAHRTMFTAHTDTVHDNGGPNRIRLDTQTNGDILWRADEGDCLGADDGAGVALLMHMIDKGVPGLYVFFRGEEVGGIGSTWLGENGKNILADIDHCVSLDRADQTDVITHQAGGRCCSDEFAEGLAAALTTEDLSMAFLPDSTGVFTDSANLTHLIPECTNLSVGYKHQHGDGEYQNVTFLQRLADQLCAVPWDDLPVKRDPMVKESKWASVAFDPKRWLSSYDSYDVKGTDVPFAADADAEYLADCLYDAAWGKRAPLLHAVATYCGCGEHELRIDAMSGIEMEKVAEELLAGKFTTDDVYSDLFDIMFNPE